MAETYIPLSAAFDALAPFCKTCRYSVNDKNCICCPYGHTRIKLNTIPAADVRPVVRGQWIDKFCGVYRCSCCEVVFDENDISDTQVRKWNFCPNCGADMRPEQKEENKQ